MNKQMVHLVNSLFVALVLMLFTACVTTSLPVEEPPKAVSFSDGVESLVPAKLGKVRIKPFIQFESYKIRKSWMEDIEEGFKNKLKAMLGLSSLFDNTEKEAINVTVGILSWRRNTATFLTDVVDITIKYEFSAEDGTVLLTEEITSSGSDSSWGAIREYMTVLATHKAISDNISKLSKRVKEELPASYHAYAQKQEAISRRIAAELGKEDGYYRVVTTQAVVRGMPDADAMEVSKLSQEELVHVTGSLPSGWLQVSREGNPLGWVHGSLLREDFASAPAVPSSKLERPHQPSVVAPTIQRYGVSQHWAVIIGISEYRHSGRNGLTNLIFADDDARAFARVLGNLGWSESHIKLLVNEEATQRNIMIALESWLTKASPNDQVVLFWAGHGFPDPEDPEKVYFACYDTDISIPATGYRMDKVRDALEERRPRNVVLLADTCHAGKLITRGDRGISIVPQIDKMHREKDVPKGWIFMVGAETDRQAIEHSSWSNGAFTHCLLNALSGGADGYLSSGAKDGIVSMGELRVYLNNVMPDETQKVLGVAKRPLVTTSTGDPDIWNLTLQAK